MTDLELTDLLLQSLQKDFNLTDEDVKVLSRLQIRQVDNSVRIQGTYTEKDETVINSLWDHITEILFSLTGCSNLVDNRIREEQKVPVSRHCGSYTTSGPHKPVDWEYVPVREISKANKKRMEFFYGHYVRLARKKSAREFVQPNPEEKQPDNNWARADE